MASGAEAIASGLEAIASQSRNVVNTWGTVRSQSLEG